MTSTTTVSGTPTYDAVLADLGDPWQLPEGQESPQKPSLVRRNPVKAKKARSSPTKPQGVTQPSPE